MSRLWLLFTVRGRAFIIIGVLLLAAGLIVSIPDLWRASLVVLILPFAAAIYVRSTHHRLSVTRSVRPSRLSVGSTADVEIVVANAGQLPTGVLMVREQVPAELAVSPRFVLDRIAPGAQRVMTYTVEGRRRGRHTLGPLEIRISDPFGLVELRRSLQTTQPFTVVPRTISLRTTPLRGPADGSGERPWSLGQGDDDVLVREYRQGDGLRRVHWRSTARVGQLMVRNEEQPNRPTAVVVLDDRLRAHIAGGTFEDSVVVAASVAVHLANAGHDLRLCTTSGSIDLMVSADAALDALAEVSRGQSAHLVNGTLPDGDLVVAVLGQLDPQDAEAFASATRRSRAVALTVGPVSEGTRWLAEHGWRVEELPTADALPHVWASVSGARRAPGLTR